MKAATARLMSSGFVDRPIFQVGASRSGTIVLYKALGTHPNVLSMPSENPVIDYFARAAALFEFGAEAWYFRESVKVDQPYFHAKLKELLFETTAGPHMGIKTLAKSLATRPLDFVQKKFWCVKCFPLEDSAHALTVLYPDSKFIYILRNGIDVVQSRTKFPAFREQSFEHHCAFWVQAARKFDYLRRWDRCLEVRQEQLLNEPEAVFSRLCRHLGIADHENPARFVRTTLVHSRGDEGTKSNVDARRMLTERAPSHDAWTDTQRSTFKRLCGEYMDKLGYEIPF